jgi:hypothetical protein
LKSRRPPTGSGAQELHELVGERFLHLESDQDAHPQLQFDEAPGPAADERQAGGQDILALDGAELVPPRSTAAY